MIRLGTSADLAAASSVYRRASLSNAGDRDSLLARPEYLILEPEGLAEGRTHVAEQDGSVVGFATWAETAGIIELEDLFVDPGYWRRGIATALVSRIAEVVRARGAWRSLPILRRWGSTAPSASPTAASRQPTSVPRPAWSSCFAESGGAIRSRRPAQAAG
jgi:GNAT superfamily N-acetyltransferase